MRPRKKKEIIDTVIGKSIIDVLLKNGNKPMYPYQIRNEIDGKPDLTIIQKDCKLLSSETIHMLVGEEREIEGRDAKQGRKKAVHYSLSLDIRTMLTICDRYVNREGVEENDIALLFNSGFLSYSVMQGIAFCSVIQLLNYGPDNAIRTTFHTEPEPIEGIDSMNDIQSYIEYFVQLYERCKVKNFSRDLLLEAYNLNGWDDITPSLDWSYFVAQAMMASPTALKFGLFSNLKDRDPIFDVGRCEWLVEEMFKKEKINDKDRLLMQVYLPMVMAVGHDMWAYPTTYKNNPQLRTTAMESISSLYLGRMLKKKRARKAKTR